MNGRNVVVREMTDIQMALMLRCSKILQSPNVEMEKKLDTVDMMFAILDSIVVQASDREWVKEQQVAGDIELKDMTGWISGFQTDEQKPATVRRSRARK